jgi:hypothetical protein
MSTTSEKQTPPVKSPARQVEIISHSMIFYWWPVWAVGFLMAGLTYLDGHRLAIVPEGTEAVEGRQVPGYDSPRDALVLPANDHFLKDPDTKGPRQPVLRMAARSSYGAVFLVILVLVIFITNVPIRGMASVVVIVTLLLLSIIFALAGWWDDIFEFLGHSHVYMNAMGYLAVAVPLVILWLVIVLFFDRRVYMIFAPGQLRVCREIGGGEVAYDTLGMSVTKRRSDLFRHWLLGFGSGDLIVKTAGAKNEQIEMPNVLFVGSKLQLIQQMLAQREVVRGG